LCLLLLQIIKNTKYCKGCDLGWSAWVCVAAGLLWLCSAGAMWHMPGAPEGEDELPPAPRYDPAADDDGAAAAAAPDGAAKEVEKE
jgi:hypothetical protein